MNYYLEKWLVIIEHNSKKLSSVPNDVKLRIHAVNKQETYYVMARYTAISSAANTINKWHILSNFNYIYQKQFYNDKQKYMDERFDEYHLPLGFIFDNPALILERKENNNTAAYDKYIDKEIKLPSKKTEIDRHGSMIYWPTSTKKVINWFTFYEYHGVYCIYYR